MEEETKHPGGRPSDYKGEETIQKVKDYLATCIDEEYQRIKTDGDKSISYELSVKVNLPSIEGLALFIGCTRDTIYNWKKEHEEFSCALDELYSEQAKRLLNNGLNGTYNPTIAKLILSGHNYIERSTTDLTTKGESLNNFSNEQAERILKRRNVGVSKPSEE